MARQGIFTGSSPNDGTGDSLLVGASKINENFLEIYSTFGDGSTLTPFAGSGIGVEIQENGSPIGTASTINFGSNLSVTFGSGIATITATGSGGIGTESDPIFTDSVAFGISATDTTNWDTSYSWGDHSLVGYATTNSLVGFVTAGALTGFITGVNISAGSNITVLETSEGNFIITSTNVTGIGGTWTQTSSGIHTLSNIGIGTTNPTSRLTVDGDAKITGVITATTFIGDGTNLSGIATNFDVASLQSQVNALGTNLNIIGFYDALSGIITSLTVVGQTRGYISLGQTLPNVGIVTGDYFIVSTGGTDVGIATYSSVGISSVYSGDWIVGVGNSEWSILSYSQQIVAPRSTRSDFATTLESDSNVNTTGIITANKYYGDGSSLSSIVTSITAGSGVSINQNTGNVTISATGGGEESYWTQTSSGIHTLSNVGIGTTNSTSALTVKGNTSLETLNVSGVSTFAGITTVTGPTLFTKQLSVSGVSTFAGITTVTGPTLFTKQLSVSGVSTLGTLRLNSLTNLTNLGTSFSNASNIINFGNDLAIFNLNDGTFGNQNWILVNEYPLYIGTKGETGGNTFYSTLITIDPGTDTYIPNTSNVKLGYGDNTTKLETIGAGVTVTGTTFTNQLNVSGIASVGSAITMYASTGIISATTFYGNVVGNITGSITDATNLTGGYANASQLNVSGIATISQGRIQADASANLRFGNLAAGSGSAGRNIAIGDQVLASLSGGQGRNIGIGELSYYDTTTGQYNIGIGERAGQKVTTGAYNVVLGAYDGNSGGLDIRTSSNNIVIADGQGNIRQYINSSGNVGIKTTVVTEALTVAGIVSATGFYGTLNAEQLTGSLPAIDGSALIGVVGSGSGVIIEDDATPVGTAGTINFGSNLDVSFAGGTATVSGVSSVSTATTAFNLAGSPNLNVGVVTATTLNVTGDRLVLPRGTSKGIHFGVPPYDDGANDSVIFVSDSVTNFGELVLNSGDYSTKIIGKSLIFRSNFEDWSSIGTETSYILSKVGIGTTNATSKLTVSGDVKVSGIITASSFSGSGANLTNLPAGQLTGVLPAIDGSALLNVTASGTGIVIDDDNVNVGSAVTVNFGTGLDVTFSAGIATITASGGSLQSRTTVSGATTSIANNGIGNTNITGFKSYALMRVGLSTAGWLRIYTDSASRDADVSRSVGEDPAPGSGVIAEVVTTGISTTQIISPFVMGGNLDNPADTTIYASIKNLSGSTQAITANLTILQLEA